MNENRLREWLEIVGIVAVVASLVFVGMEIRQSARAASEEGIAGDLANMIAVESLVTANPDIWHRGCMGEDLSPPDQMVYTHIYHAYEFLHFMRWLRGNIGVHDAGEGLAIDNFAMNLYRSPGIQKEWQRHGDWRHHVPDHHDFQRWRVLVERRTAEFPKFEPDPIDDPYRCGLN